MRLDIFLLFLALQTIITWPLFMKTCRASSSIGVNILHFLHHALDIFNWWGPLFFLTRPIEYLIHFVVVLLIGIHWLTNDNICEVSRIVNKACGYDTKKWLDSLKSIIFGGSPRIVQLAYMGILLFIDYTQFRRII